MRHKQQGMTLIEVLIASTILFSVLALLSQVMVGALKSSEQAEKNINISYNMPFIVDKIKLEIKDDGSLSGNYSYSDSVSYRWQAQLNQQQPIYQTVMQNSSNGRQVKLYQIDLTVKYNSLAKEFTYLEVISE